MCLDFNVGVTINGTQLDQAFDLLKILLDCVFDSVKIYQVTPSLGQIWVTEQQNKSIIATTTFPNIFLAQKFTQK